ncbi:SMC-Scp complex subunit ScpB [Shimazuella kribbensis]|uniref:SMC-Scp complex subunit ScpB n=1 Tax=Shimazuella kribbensis TaxID=139808 RepID=UPI00041EA358|nr:SMC-Scp complex subunit ScpB [Shimazuella kribbensis]
MEAKAWKSILEGIIFAAGTDGINVKELAEIVEIPKQEVQMLLNEMQLEWKLDHRGTELVQIAGKYQITTLPEHTVYIQKMAQAPTRVGLSRAAIEVLAIIAYKQPVTRVEIEEIRGVKSDRILQQLERKELIRQAGRAEGPGRPILFGTSRQFLQYFGLNKIDELPSPESIFHWQEWEEDRKNLYERLGVEGEEKVQEE